MRNKNTNIIRKIGVMLSLLCVVLMLTLATVRPVAAEVYAVDETAAEDSAESGEMKIVKVNPSDKEQNWEISYEGRDIDDPSVIHSGTIVYNADGSIV